ncbi:MAG: penicillin-binding transpeptidase domain-containing protein [Actinomycetota bacterium]
MTNRSDDRKDRALRDAAQKSLDRHHRSVRADEVEMALQAARVHIVGGKRTHRPTGPIVAAAAAVILLVGALVAVSNRPNDRAVTDMPTAPSVDQTTLPSRTTTPSTTSRATSVDSAPATLHDVHGAPILGASSGSGSDEAGSFHDVVVEHLLHHSEILGDSVDERRRQLDVGGLQIYTTLDPATQRAAEDSRSELPANSRNIEAALVSLDTNSGAVRALVGPANDDGVNMAMKPRQSGSAIGLFIVAAAVEAGAQSDDVIDARRDCTLPTSNPAVPALVIESGAAGMVGTLREVASISLSCGMARLSMIVGLDHVVDTTYQMASSDYLQPGVSNADRPPLEPFASLATGANELSALDMASGVQTLANEGVHRPPYFVEFVDDADGNRLYTHTPSEQRVLGRAGTLETIDLLKSVLREGTARRHAPLASERPAFGVTGSQLDATNAWFVGATPQLSSAVWVGDPNAYTPMIDISEFAADGVPTVQGGRYPTQIWKAFTDAALEGTPATDWEPPPAPAREPVRLVLSGNECLSTGGSASEPPQQIPLGQPLTTVDVDSDVVPCR